mgnify:CR=1 FL=1
MPKVSVIIPVYNVAPYLRQCLDSVVNQTLRDIEIICVDDGSTDGSAAILAEYAAKDPRVKVLVREHTNAGAARNAGMAVATGDWLFFADADDFCGAEMLSRMTTADGADDADVVVAGHRILEDGKYSGARLPRRFVHAHAPENGEWPAHFFIDAGVMPWNKLFRRSFIIGKSLVFQEIPRHNDICFTCCSLAGAAGIAVSDTCGYVYRRGRRGSVTEDRDAAPTLFADVLSTLKEELVRRGLFAKSMRACLNLALAHCCYHLLGEFDAGRFSALFSSLRNGVLAKLGLKDADAAIFVNRKHCRYLEAILSDETPISLLMVLLRERYADWRELGARAERIAGLANELAEAKKNAASIESRLSNAKNESAELCAKLADSQAHLRIALEECETVSRRLDAVLSSRSYRTGRALARPVTAIRKCFSAFPRHTPQNTTPNQTEK